MKWALLQHKPIPTGLTRSVYTIFVAMWLNGPKKKWRKVVVGIKRLTKQELIMKVQSIQILSEVQA